MFDSSLLEKYKIVEHHYSEDLKSEAYLMEHIKSGARIALLDNDEENKVFYIGFRTPPKDSTGVAHILEHSVLCGSEKFPLKDPFVELVKGSLNTFLNAMTYPDKTVYPVASCNDKDFKNLMDVYMDAVLHPNIYREEKIFRQEGWHLEMEDKNDDLKINGVVYNEMKGAFSSPEDVLYREIMNSLYPDTAYGVESGGDPECIPDLTYEEFLKFHGSYYHPVNSYIYMYGNADWNERLKWLDERYLSEYDRIDIESFPGRQKPFDSVSYITKEYPISEDEKEEDNTFLSYNAVIGDSTDRELYLAFQIVDYALIDADGTPLKKALLEAGIGTEIMSTFENGICEPYYSIVAKNANPEDEAKFVELIENEFRRVVKEGFDKNALLADLNYLEFKYREADSGHYPKGLLMGLKCLDSWLYDDAKPFIHVEELDTFAKLREKIETHYFEDLVEKYLLGNIHRSVLKLIPKKGLTAIKDKALADKLAAYKASLSDKEIDAIVENTKALKLFQDTPDSEEALKCLPVLKRSDIRKEAEPLINEWTEVDGIKTLFHDIDTNGIVYLTMLFDMDKLPFELYPYAGLLNGVLRSVDTAKHTYDALGYEVDKYTGCISMSSDSAVINGNLSEYKRYLTVKLSAMTQNIPQAFDLLGEIMLTSKLDDTKRLKEIIAEGRSRIQSTMLSSGHLVAAAHAAACASEFAKTRELISGLDYYRCLEDWEEHFDEKKDEIVAGLKETLRIVYRKENLFLDVTGSKTELDSLKGLVSPITDALDTAPVTADKGRVEIKKEKSGLSCSSQVQYVCRYGNFKDHGMEYKGSMHILHTILGYDYLWTNVRVKGGAYGCMNSFGRYGASYFVSYRDPNLKETIDIFEKAAEYLKGFKADEDTMTKYIIGTMSDIDIPRMPSAKGSRSLHAELEGISYEQIQKERDEILSANDEDIRALAAYVEAFMSDDILCVVGNETKINSAKECFDVTEPLFH